MKGMRKFATILFPATKEEDLEKFDAVVEEAYKNNDGEFGIAAAKQWYKTQGKPIDELYGYCTYYTLLFSS